MTPTITTINTITRTVTSTLDEFEAGFTRLSLSDDSCPRLNYTQLF